MDFWCAREATRIIFLLRFCVRFFCVVDRRFAFFKLAIVILCTVASTEFNYFNKEIIMKPDTSVVNKPAGGITSFPPSTTAGGGPLEAFVLLSKSASGAAAAQLVQQAVGTPNVYVFGELLRSPNIQELASKPDTKPFWDLLHLFAYGTYGDYLRNRAVLPQLTESMTLKLRQLTIVSLAAANKYISYAQLLTELGVQNVRELEDLIIDAIYNGVIVGKLDQRHQLLEVDRCMGRDVRAEEIPSIVSTLADLCDRCEILLAITEDQMKRANAAKLEAAERKKYIDAEFTKAKKSLKTTSALASHAPDADDFMADVSSSAEPEKKKEKPGRKGAGLRGSASGRSWLQKN